jgi:hypothetical protein
VVPLLQPEAVGPYPVRGPWFPSHLLLERTRLYLDLLARNWWAMVPRVQDPTVAPKPSVERLAGVVRSTGGRIGTDMSLWVSPRDSVVRPWG